jgi:molybdopterin-guanine dinucleotide biosynthesis protein A
MIHGVIIAGGQGRRLGGVRKADIEIGGVRLIERVAARLEGVASPVLVSTGPAAAEWLLRVGFEAVPDLGGDLGGPLAGLVAAVARLRDRQVREGILISAAVDTPFLPRDYVTRLVKGLEHAPVAFSAWREAFYPPNAAWQIEAILDLPERMADVGSLKGLQRDLGGGSVGWDEMPDNPFDNANTPPDLLALEERAKCQADL